MANDIDISVISALGVQLTGSKLALTNNPEYQTIKGLIAQMQQIAMNINDTNAAAALVQQSLNRKLAILTGNSINLINVDTSAGPVSIILANVVVNFTIIKDATGNASTNHITMVGIVDGVTNPQITINFGSFRVRVLGTAFTTW